ncbi:hypothetical protein DFH06DRAFT_1321200 [Mycena polygramma]|nr:hypothetical protein DFH06DRAFT_1321200 [Mycena polygramma]
MSETLHGSNIPEDPFAAPLSNYDASMTQLKESPHDPESWKRLVDEAETSGDITAYIDHFLAIKRFAQQHTYHSIDAIAEHDLGIAKTRKLPSRTVSSVHPGGLNPWSISTLIRTATRSGLSPNPTSVRRRRQIASTKMIINARDPTSVIGTGEHTRCPSASASGPSWDRVRVKPLIPPRRREKEEKPPLHPVIHWFLTQLPPGETFDGPVLNAENLMETLRNAVIPSTICARSPPPAARESEFAKEVLEAQVTAHDRYIAARSETRSFPTLVECCAELLDAIHIDELAMVGPAVATVVGSHLWEWDRIPYSILCKALTGLNMDRDGDKLDEWVLRNEKWLREGNHTSWQKGLVRLEDAPIVFPQSGLSDTGDRTIMRSDMVSSPNFQVLSNCREPSTTITGSTDAFKHAFRQMSDGLLENLDWSNVCVAGGIVLGTLLRPHNVYADSDLWETSDIDIYIYGLSATEATAKIQSIYMTCRDNIQPGQTTLVVRNSKTITLYSEWPTRRVQFVLKLVDSPKEVLLNFDLDICAMGWDGSNVWMLPRAARALETGLNVFTMNLIHGHYLSARRASQPQRLFKYAHKGYGLRFLPSYLSSLLPSAESIPGSPSEEDALSQLSHLADAARTWATDKHEELKLIRGEEYTLHFSDLGGVFPHRGCFATFSTFMRSVAYWEIAKRESESGSPLGNFIHDTYKDEYDEDDTSPTGQPVPGYGFNPRFQPDGLRTHITKSNRREVRRWLRTDSTGRLEDQHGVKHEEELDDAQRVTFAPRIEVLLDNAHDIKIPLLLPTSFAVYANEIVNHMPEPESGNSTILKLAIPGTSRPVELVDGFSQEGLYFWTVPSHLMWQQKDRRIDELFEVLYAFRRANDPIPSTAALQVQRVVEELSRRTATMGESEQAFSRWVISQET